MKRFSIIFLLTAFQLAVANEPADWSSLRKMFSESNAPADQKALKGWWNSKCYETKNGSLKTSAGLMVYRDKSPRRDSFFMLHADAVDYWDTFTAEKKAEIYEVIETLPPETWNNVILQYNAVIGFVYANLQFFARVDAKGNLWVARKIGWYADHTHEFDQFCRVLKKVHTE